MVIAQSPPLTEIASFHAQQAVEKIHDLDVLLQRCAKLDPTFAGLAVKVAPLTPFAVRFRYPGPGNPSVEEAQEAVAVVKEIWRFALERLPDEAAP